MLSRTFFPLGGRKTLLSFLGFSPPYLVGYRRLYDRDESQDFVSLVSDLDEPGVLTGTKEYAFVFTDIEKSYDTYSGLNVRTREPEKKMEQSMHDTRHPSIGLMHTLLIVVGD